MKSCKNCGNEKMTFGEAWFDHNGDYRHAQYYYCPECYTVYNVVGETVAQLDRPLNIQLTFKF